MKIASAQIKVNVGDLAGNFEKHLEFINLAIDNNVDLVVFPEMSLTGYCRKKGRELMIKPTDPKILELEKKAQSNNIVIVVGAPIEIEQLLYIGTYIMMPTGETKVYIKQFLHEGEDEFYASSFQFNPKIKIDEETICFAICADINHEQHAINAIEKGCSIYVPSIFFSNNGIANGIKLLAKYAKTHAMNILMSNYAGALWGVEAGGKSGFWNEKGELVGQLGAKNEELLVMGKEETNWVIKKCIKKNNGS